MKNTHTTQKGFSLFEVVIYIGLFSICIGGVLVGTYNMIESNQRNQTQSNMEIEGQFILSKTGWLISTAQLVSTPAPGTNTSTLTVTPYDTSTYHQYTISTVAHAITLTRGNQTPQILNDPTIDVSNISFSRTNEVESAITTTFTLTTRTPQGATLSHTFSEIFYVY